MKSRFDDCVNKVPLMDASIRYTLLYWREIWMIVYVVKKMYTMVSDQGLV